MKNNPFKIALVIGSAFALAFIFSCSGDSSNGGTNGTHCIVQQATNGYDVLCDGVKVGKLNNGEPGEKGERGEKGEKGDKGDPGAQGATGATGATGPAGAQGEKGDKGDPGETGATGADGKDGKDGIGLILKGTVTTRSNLPCYSTTAACTNPPAQGDLYVVTNDGSNNAYKAGDGFVYNGQTWQNIGPVSASPTIKDGYWYIGSTNTGVKAQGTDGVNGTNGADGAKGEKGDKGDTGAAGVAGAKGEKGDKGDTGASGTDGAKGDKGDKGDTGATGAAGAKGEKGDKGDTGASGTDGAKGDKGDKGDTGAAGTDGTNGISPNIGANGNWWIDTYDTGVKAIGIEINAKGNIGSLPTSGQQQGDMYICNDHLYVWNSSANNGLGDWVDIGMIRGPKGDTGAKGDKGDKGEKGDKGDKGDTGVAGAKGDKGDKGDAGADGKDVALKGSKSTIGELPNCVEDIHGDLYLVQGDGYFCDGNDWENIGPIQGPPGNTPTVSIDANGFWVINGETTTVSAIGAPGPQGPAGAQGAPGENGADGKSCKVKTEGSGYIIRCEDDHGIYQTVGNLLNGVGCTISTDPTNSAYYLIKCGSADPGEQLAKAWCGPTAYDPAIRYCKDESSGTTELLKTTGNFPTTPAPTIYKLGLNPGEDITKLNLNWFSKTGTTSKVRVFKGNYLVTTGSATATSFTCSGSNCGDIGTTTTYIHKVTVTGLEQNTTYKYQVSNDGTNWSPEYEYKTPPAMGYFKFAAVADVQLDCSVNTTTTGCTTGKETWNGIVNKIYDAGATLIVNAGDHAQMGREDEYDAYFYPSKLRSIPTASVMGNHDGPVASGTSGWKPNFDNHFNLPNLQTGSATYTYGNSNYYFLYNRVLFVGLNTSPYPGGTYSSSSYSSGDAESYITDFENTIDVAKRAHSPLQYDFIVVTHHKSTNSVTLRTQTSNGNAYTANGHVIDNDVLNYVTPRTGIGIQQLMTKKGVDLVITGHDHVYVRSQLMKDNKPSTDKTGTLYLTLKPGANTTQTYVPTNVGVSSSSSSLTHTAGTNTGTSFINNYPFFKPINEITGKCKEATNTDYYRGGEYLLPESYACHSKYVVNNPGYQIIEVNNGRMLINVHEANGDIFESILLTPTLPKFSNN